MTHQALNFIQTAKSGSLENFRRLLRQGIDVNCRGHHGQTALMEASTNGHIRMVSDLLHYGADPNLQGNGGETALMNAVYYGHHEIMIMLIDKGANVNISCIFRNTALMYAACCECCEILLQRGANPNLQDKDGRTVLMAAVAGGQVQIANLLLEYGADPDIQDVYGRSTWTFCENYGATDLLHCGQVLDPIPFSTLTCTNDTCSICITLFHEDESVVNLSCQHTFHDECIRTWLNTKHSCPQCRRYTMAK